LFNSDAREQPHTTPTPTGSPTPRRRIAPARPGRKRAVAWESDTELVAQILGGSRVHFEMLYEAYFPRVFRFALKRRKCS
jgi:hypothetical protein